MAVGSTMVCLPSSRGHSDVERLSEDSLYGLVQFVWYAVLDIAASK